MKIKLQSGDIKLVEELDQLTANTRAYVGQGKASLADAITAPHGVPAAGQYWVDVSYDARPVGCLDITTLAYGSITNSQTNQFTNYFINTFTTPLPGCADPAGNVVPSGYIFVIRQISDLALRVNAVASTFNQLIYVTGNLDILINGSLVKNGTLSGIDTDTILDTFIVVDENQTITLNMPSGYSPLSTNVRAAGYFEIVCTIYGHLIEKNRPVQFVIANETNNNKVIVSKGKL